MKNKEFKKAINYLVNRIYDGYSYYPNNRTNMFLGYIDHLWEPKYSENINRLMGATKKLVSGTYSYNPDQGYEVYLYFKRLKAAIRIWYVVAEYQEDVYDDIYIKKEVTLSLDYFNRIVELIKFLNEKGYTNILTSNGIDELKKAVKERYDPIFPCNGFYPEHRGSKKFVSEELAVIVDERWYGTEMTGQYDSYKKEIYCAEKIGINKLRNTIMSIES